MTVEQARERYLALGRTAANLDRWCRYQHATRRRLWLDVDAASISLDLATAEAVARKSIAY